MFRFPEITKYESPLMQYAKIEEETKEALYEMMRADAKNEAIELVDVIHACETQLRALGLTDVDYDSIEREVTEKNRARGYYG